MKCPTCGRFRPCPTCGQDGDFLQGAPRTEMFHYFRRSIDSLHKLRQLLIGVRMETLANAISFIIQQLERVEDLTTAVEDDDPTGPH